MRESSRLLRPYNPALDVSPFDTLQVADAGDVALNPFDIHEAIDSLQAAALDLTAVGVAPRTGRAPAYDHAEITGIAASHVAYDLISLLAIQHDAPN